MPLFSVTQRYGLHAGATISGEDFKSLLADLRRDLSVRGSVGVRGRPNDYAVTIVVEVETDDDAALVWWREIEPVIVERQKPVPGVGRAIGSLKVRRRARY